MGADDPFFFVNVLGLSKKCQFMYRGTCCVILSKHYLPTHFKKGTKYLFNSTQFISLASTTSVNGESMFIFQRLFTCFPTSILR